jgi:HSP20 family molecular chaperone IbpA
MLNLELFDFMFPNYSEFRTPMTSSWKDDDNKTTLSVVVPGYEKEDFELFFDDNSLKLRIKSGKGDLLYSILDKFYVSQYNLDEAEAEYHSGVLKISIPKVAKKKAKQLSIKVS